MRAVEFLQLGKFALVVLILVGVTGCGATSANPDLSEFAGPSGQDELVGTLQLTGSSTVGPLAAEIGKRFSSLHPYVRVDVQLGGSSRGVADAGRGLADIGMVSRDLKPDEDLQIFTIAQDGICVIVHKSNPVAELTDQQVIDIYTGRIENWNEVGGEDLPIIVVNKAEGRSTLELFLAYFQLTSDQIEADSVIGDNEQGVKVVAGSPAAIGYVSVGTAEYDAAQGVLIKLLPLGGVVASTATVQDGTFPLARPLNLVTKGQPEGLAARFIEFAQSSEADDLVKELSYVPLSH